MFPFKGDFDFGGKPEATWKWIWWIGGWGHISLAFPWMLLSSRFLILKKHLVKSQKKTSRIDSESVEKDRVSLSKQGGYFKSDLKQQVFYCIFLNIHCITPCMSSPNSSLFFPRSGHHSSIIRHWCNQSQKTLRCPDGKSLVMQWVAHEMKGWGRHGSEVRGPFVKLCISPFCSSFRGTGTTISACLKCVLWRTLAFSLKGVIICWF